MQSAEHTWVVKLVDPAVYGPIQWELTALNQGFSCKISMEFIFFSTHEDLRKCSILHVCKMHACLRIMATVPTACYLSLGAMSKL